MSALDWLRPEYMFKQQPRCGVEVVPMHTSSSRPSSAVLEIINAILGA